MSATHTLPDDSDCLQAFHPAVRHWFQSRFGEPTLPQRRGWPAIQSGTHALIAAPTGSGKTLAAFLAALDRLFRAALDGSLEARVKVVYVSPLRALSNDIHRNLIEPLEGICEALNSLGYGGTGSNPKSLPQVRAAVRTGDTPASQRQAMIRNPPHILVTTPESLYLLMTSVSGRKLLAGVEALIVDEIHALAGDRRGAHLALTIERLVHLAGQQGHRIQRIGLSATQRPMALVAGFLVGNRHLLPDGQPDCQIIDEGHLRHLDLAIEVPGSPLEAVMSREVWQEQYRRLIELIESHRTTLIFVNTRRMAERITQHLAEKLGENRVASHHGSLAADIRHDAESRLKSGHLKVIVATASLELGIDIGYVDLVCQIGTTRAIATLLQRVGRSGHYYGGTPKGRLFPLTRDELIECAAMLDCIRRGDLDRLIVQAKPLDVLAQQIVAASADYDWPEDELFALVSAAFSYQSLEREEFDQIVQMLAEGISTKRGRRGAHIFYDGINGMIKARKGARLTALTCGGAIPDMADYRVLLEPEGTVIGTLHEDFAIESMPGDIFQLGNNSWQIARVESSTVRVHDAHGQPPTIPFWLGEARSRSDELSTAVAEFRVKVGDLLSDPPKLRAFLEVELRLPPPAASLISAYIGAGLKALGVVPSRKNLVIERFFDESGGMQLVIHAPFGSRLNRAWGLALRKRFCRSFNFELQAAATEDAIVLSLGPKHSFPLEDVFGFLHSGSVREVLIQALLDAPMFQTHWRWNASRSLALRRFRGGKRVPPNLQRMNAEDLLAVVFPDQLACQENLVGEREVPDHPLVNQTIKDCLTLVMDIEGLESLLRQIEREEVQCLAIDLPEPSPLAHEVLNAMPYAFLDDAPLEERRTRALHLRRTLDPERIGAEGLLDPIAIETVRNQAWPDPESVDEVHEALLLMGGLRMAAREAIAENEPKEHLEDGQLGNKGGKCEPILQNGITQENKEWLGLPGAAWRRALPELLLTSRVTFFHFEGEDGPVRLLIAAERIPQWSAAVPDGRIEPHCAAPRRERGREWGPESAKTELVRGRIEIHGPTTAAHLAQFLGLPAADIDLALYALEAEGFVLRGHFDPQFNALQWCHRGLLARIHQLTLHDLRAQIKPVSVGEFMRFLCFWQRVDQENRAEGVHGLEAVIESLEGFEAAASAWESDLLPVRVRHYRPDFLDQLCLAGKVSWARIQPPKSVTTGGFVHGPLKTSPIALFMREHTAIWLREGEPPPELTGYAAVAFQFLRQRGACFFGEIRDRCGLLHTQTEMALGELVARGLVAADSFAGLRALLRPSREKNTARLRGTGGFGGRWNRNRFNPQGIEAAGRWSVLEPPETSYFEGGVDRPNAAGAVSNELENGVGKSSENELNESETLEYRARVLLRRYGVVFRKLLEREDQAPGWGALLRAFRRMEAVGEVRGGHFVSGCGGEHFALPEAVGLLRSLRNKGERSALIAISGCDPLNQTGTLLPGVVIARHPANRILLRDGIPVAALEGGRFISFPPTENQSEESDSTFEAMLRGSLVKGKKPAWAVSPTQL